MHEMFGKFQSNGCNAMGGGTWGFWGRGSSCTQCLSKELSDEVDGESVEAREMQKTTSKG